MNPEPEPGRVWPRTPESSGPVSEAGGRGGLAVTGARGRQAGAPPYARTDLLAWSG